MASYHACVSDEDEQPRAAPLSTTTITTIGAPTVVLRQLHADAADQDRAWSAATAAARELEQIRVAAAAVYDCSPEALGDLLLQELLGIGAAAEQLAVRAERLARALPAAHPDRPRLEAIAPVLAVVARADVPGLQRLASAASAFLGRNVIAVGGTIGPGGARTMPRTAIDPSKPAPWDDAARLQVFMLEMMTAGVPQPERAARLVDALAECPSLRAEVPPAYAERTREERIAMLAGIDGRLYTKRLKDDPEKTSGDALERHAQRYVRHAMAALGMPKRRVHAVFEATDRTKRAFAELKTRVRLTGGG